MHTPCYKNSAWNDDYLVVEGNVEEVVSPLVADVDLLLEGSQSVFVGNVLYHDCCSAIYQNLLILNFKFEQ